MEKSFMNCLTLILGIILLISGMIKSAPLLRQGYASGFDTPFTTTENTGSTPYVRKYALGGKKTAVTTVKREILFPSIMILAGVCITAGAGYQFKKDEQPL